MAALPVADTTSAERGLCLLSLDGGGIRGLSELIIIEELMERIKWNKKLDKTPIPADIFDLIGGTSTGRLRLSAAEAILHYETLAKAVFSQKKAKGKDGTFKASKLKEAIEEVLRKTLGPGHIDARMYEEEMTASKKCRAFACAVGTSDITHAAGPTLFRSYDVAKNKEYDCKIWEAARATSAAPTFFKRIKIGPSGSGIDYVDAGIGCNNPIKQVIAEAARVFGDEAPVACVVSIGTGQSGSVGLAQPDAFQKWLPTDLIKGLEQIATDTGRVAEEMELRYKDIPGLYNRLDVDRGLHSISLAEWKQLGSVREHTKNYMRLEVIDRRVDHVVKTLCGLCPDQTCKAGNLIGLVRPRANTFLRINVPQKRVYHFVTRQTLLAEITSRIFSNHSAETVVLLGMGGAGKTQLALEVCRQAEENGRFGAVIWVDASSPRSVIQSYRIIAQKILKHQSYNLDAEDTLCLQVRDALQDWNRLWLIIFDNYDNPQAFKGHSIKNYVPTGKSGRILFTSRHQDSARLGHKIDASTMTEDESLKLLIQRLPLSEDESIHGRKIVSTLGYLALALDQAGAYIRARSLSLQEFIQHYNDRKEVVLQEIPDQWEYGRAIDDEERETKLRIFTTWELSFNQISGQEHEIKDKEHFLTLAAFFDAGSISERYFQAYFNKSNPDWMEIFSSGDRWDSYKLGDVLSEFQKLSLLQKRSPANEGLLISIHPVICDWIRLRKSPEVQHDFAAELTAALTDYLEDTDFDALSLGTKQETVRHIDSCILGDKTLSGHILDTLPRSMGLFAYFYSEQGRYNESEDLSKRALVVCKEKLGATHLDTLRTMETQAINYRWLGQYDEAERLHEQILFEFENMFGGMHSATLAAVIPLGLTYVSQGRYVEAERILKRALRGCEDTWGLTHTRTLVVVVSLAVVYKEQGRYDEAETLCQRALVGQEEELGVENPSTLLSVEILAIVYRRKGRYDEAETLYKRALSGNRENFGETHPRTLGTMRNLAITYNYQDRYDEAVQLLEQALNASMKTLGAKYPDTLGIMLTLADTYHHQDRYIEAKDLFEPALAKYIETLGATHSETLRVVKNLAICYRDLGQLEEAKELFKQALTGFTETLDTTHSNTLYAMHDLAVCYRDLGQLEEAKELFEQALTGFTETLGSTHSNTLRVANNLAIYYRDLGQHKEAEELENRYPSIQNESNGSLSPLTSMKVLEASSPRQFRHDFTHKLHLFKRAIHNTEEKSHIF